MSQSISSTLLSLSVQGYQRCSSQITLHNTISSMDEIIRIKEDGVKKGRNDRNLIEFIESTECKSVAS